MNAHHFSLSFNIHDRQILLKNHLIVDESLTWFGFLKGRITISNPGIELQHWRIETVAK